MSSGSSTRVRWGPGRASAPLGGRGVGGGGRAHRPSGSVVVRRAATALGSANARARPCCSLGVGLWAGFGGWGPGRWTARLVGVARTVRGGRARTGGARVASHRLTSCWCWVLCCCLGLLLWVRMWVLVCCRDAVGLSEEAVALDNGVKRQVVNLLKAVRLVTRSRFGLVAPFVLLHVAVLLCRGNGGRVAIRWWRLAQATNARRPSRSRLGWLSGACAAADVAVPRVRRG